MSRGNNSSLLTSFNYAFVGLVHVFRHQRNMQIHFALAFLVLVATLFIDLSRLEMMAVLGAITLVLITEMMNTAVEAAVDLVSSSYDPRAKIAKDVAAGAVLISAANAVVVGYLVFAEKIARPGTAVITSVRGSAPHLTFVTLILVILMVVVLKAGLGRGRAFSGGLPSGHAALAFAGWAALTFIAAGADYGVLVSAVAFIMALLVAQTRIQSGVHTAREVAAGAFLGALATTLVFQLLY